MKNLYLNLFFLFIILPVSFTAQEKKTAESYSAPIYPGKTLLSHTGWEGEIFSNGYGAAASLGASLLPSIPLTSQFLPYTAGPNLKTIHKAFTPYPLPVLP